MCLPGAPILSLAPSGLYNIDPDHTSVIVKVSHIGYAMSVFRFGKVEGTLSWDPNQPSAGKLMAKVGTASIATPVEGFAKELTGDQYLQSGKFPDATFVSTRFVPKDATHGTVEGQFSFLGRTKPLNFDVILMGAGKGFMGHPRIGIAANGAINPGDFGLNPLFATPIMIEIDAEFAQTS